MIFVKLGLATLPNKTSIIFFLGLLLLVVSNLYINIQKQRSKCNKQQEHNPNDTRIIKNNNGISVKLSFTEV